MTADMTSDTRTSDASLACHPADTSGTFSDPARQALDQLDAATFQWARRVQRGEFARRMIRRLQLDLELAEFQGLTAIVRLQFGVGGLEPRAASVGDLAEEMAIDPSRASRIAAVLVNKGFVRRQAAQGDGRKSILELSGAGIATMHLVRLAKSDMTAKTFANWPEADIVAFSGLFSRFAAEGLKLPDPDDGADAARDAIAGAVARELNRRSDAAGAENGIGD